MRETSAWGVAALAGVGAGVWNTVAEAARLATVDRVFRPKRSTRDIADIGRREDSSYPVRPDDMRVEAAWLWPVDHPHVQASTLRGLSSALTQHDAARPVYQGRGGHPPLIARSLFERLATCANIDGGARSVLGAADTIDVPVDDPGCVRDVDTPADLEAV